MSRAPRVWALIGARAGDNDQVIALAEALGIPFEIKRMGYNALRLLGPRLLGRSLLSLSQRSRREIKGEALPDLTISAGHRSVAAVQWLRNRSGGRMRAIHIGFPRISPGQFDLVIATPQYPIADHANLLRTPYALTRAATREVDCDDYALLEPLPRPAALLLIGGPSLYWKLSRTALLATLREMLKAAQRSGGSVLVTSSPRTPEAIRSEIQAILAASEVKSILASPNEAPRYSSLLNAADAIFVTADSVAMVSDAIWTGKPVALVKVTKSALGRLAMAVSDVLRPRGRVYPHDLRWFWKALREIGISDHLAVAETSTSEEMHQVLARVLPIVRSLSDRRPS